MASLYSADLLEVHFMKVYRFQRLHYCNPEYPEISKTGRAEDLGPVDMGFYRIDFEVEVSTRVRLHNIIDLV